MLPFRQLEFLECGMQFVYHIYGMTEIGSTIAVTIDVRNLGVFGVHSKNSNWQNGNIY